MTDRKVGKVLDKIVAIPAAHFWAFFLPILVLALFNFFFGLDRAPVQPWDEARYGVTAFEMIQDHDPIVSRFNHRTDLWNLKPPLGAWSIAAAFRCFGSNVFALRFFSALSAFLAVLAVGMGMRRRIGPLPALLSSLVLSTTFPFLFTHGARTGNCSSMLALFVLLGIVCFEKAVDEPGYFSLCGVLFSASFLLYSFASFQMLVVFAVFGSLHRKRIGAAWKWLALFLLCALGPIVIWALFRLKAEDGPEFLKAMFSYDLVKRSTEPIEEHYSGVGFYIRLLFRDNAVWSWFLVVVMILGRREWVRMPRFGVLAALAVFLPLFLFSMARTRLEWYIDPIYPPLAMMTGLFAGMLLCAKESPGFIRGTVLVLLLFAVTGAETLILERILDSAPSPSEVLLKDWGGNKGPGKERLFVPDRFQSEIFYAEVLHGFDTVAIHKAGDCSGQKGHLLLPKDKRALDFDMGKGLEVELENAEWRILGLK